MARSMKTFAVQHDTIRASTTHFDDIEFGADVRKCLTDVADVATLVLNL
jgi:hypothetical protein